LAEHATENRGVGSSILPLATTQGLCSEAGCTTLLCDYLISVERWCGAAAQTNDSQTNVVVSRLSALRGISGSKSGRQDLGYPVVRQLTEEHSLGLWRGLYQKPPPRNGSGTDEAA
jgi:hypothetical protein